jgi:hypothetical protein
MLNAIETIARQAEAYLGHLSSLHRLGLDSVETAAKINAATGHKFIAQLSRNADAITSGKTSDLLVGWNKIVAEHWEASTGYTLQAQQEFLVIVERMTLGSTTKKS